VDHFFVEKEIGLKKSFYGADCKIRTIFYASTDLLPFTIIVILVVSNNDLTIL
jgi:hypothetical protein